MVPAAAVCGWYCPSRSSSEQAEHRASPRETTTKFRSCAEIMKGRIVGVELIGSRESRPSGQPPVVALGTSRKQDSAPFPTAPENFSRSLAPPGVSAYLAGQMSAKIRLLSTDFDGTLVAHSSDP